MLGRLPANPSVPDATAGLSFATIRTSAALPAEAASLDILVERLAQFTGRCERLAALYPELATLLDTTRLGTQRIANRIAECADESRQQQQNARSVSVSPAVDEPPAPRAPPQPVAAAGGVEIIPGSEIDLVYDGKRCIHARHCVLGQPGVFKANVEGPWIDPDAASTEDLVTVAHMCPSGAIRYRRHDGGAEEAPPPVNLVQLRENGPLGIRADIVLDGTRIGMRAVLCRCGASKHKPFCDGSHNDAHFRASGEPDTIESAPLAARGGPLHVDPEIDGPLVVTGNLEICCGTGRTVNRVTATRLCRCGGSSNKPFCDGTHRRNGFRSEA
jgi:CDGSH-type Zn-finger protein/uncharacterized Fe-S cluster protein YjdI